jgi:hypothetical protein
MFVVVSSVRLPTMDRVLKGLFKELKVLLEVFEVSSLIRITRITKVIELSGILYL